MLMTRVAESWLSVYLPWGRDAKFTFPAWTLNFQRACKAWQDQAIHAEILRKESVRVVTSITTGHRWQHSKKKLQKLLLKQQQQQQKRKN